MGYNTYFTGEILIDPPLTWAEIRDSEFLGDDRDVKLRVVQETVDTDDGQLTRKTADAIVPVYEDSYKGYSIVEHTQALVDQIGAGHTFTGRLDAEGEDAGDLWRLYVHDGRAVKVKPRIVWPDEADGGES